VGVFNVIMQRDYIQIVCMLQLDMPVYVQIKYNNKQISIYNSFRGLFNVHQLITDITIIMTSYHML